RPLGRPRSQGFDLDAQVLGGRGRQAPRGRSRTLRTPLMSPMPPARRRAAALAAAFGLGGCAGQGEAPRAAAAVPPSGPVSVWTGFRDHPHGYLTAQNTPNAAHFLPPPPAEDSLREQADIAAYRQMRALEGTERWDIARADNEIE